MQNIIYENKKIRKERNKIIIFDFDWTIVKPKEGRTFPLDANDWQWLRESVPNEIRKYYKKQFRIAFLTDQTKLWKIEMIKDVIKELNIPILCLIAMKKENHKPNPQFLLENIKDKYDFNNSFLVGDAAGRKNDWSDNDKKLAENIGLKFFTPEEIFKFDKEKTNKTDLNKLIKIKIKIKKEKEVIIMIGYPASGKSTIAKTIFEPNGYKIIDGDALKTPTKMIKEANKYIKNNSIVFDATNGTKERRNYYIDFAKANNLNVRCIWKTTSIDKAMEQNKKRELEGGVKIPNIVFYVYKKKFEEPTKEECEIVKVE